MKKTKLPKQWRHWCADQGLRPEGVYQGRQHEWSYLVGRGHHWRVALGGVLQRGDAYADFDRWALCPWIVRPVPQTRAEFRVAVAELLAES